MSWHIPLVVAAIAFLAVIVWRARPAFGPARPSLRIALREARERIEAAKDDKSKAVALCDAADACALSLGRAQTALGYYLRAMRCDRHSVEIIHRAAKGLKRRPRDLENLLWRRLASEKWEGEMRETAIVALQHLIDLYDDRLRSPHRARALEHAIASLQR
jgi:tetratricopeptide (TPR) repeat protein